MVEKKSNKHIVKRQIKQW